MVDSPTSGGDKGRRAPTVMEVARAAGVSAMTVSRVVNGKLDVSPPTRSRVETAIAELGNVPNQSAQSLASKRYCRKFSQADGSYTE